MSLRAATEDSHARTESIVRLGSAFELGWYCTVLRAFDVFLAAWEPRMAAALPPSLRDWFATRCRGELARRDLAALGAARTSAVEVSLPALDDASAAFGSLYVLEGSALGGQLIAREAARLHGLDADSGAAYFTGWGARTGSMWREFQQVLESHDAAGADHAGACRAAVQTFDVIASTLGTVAHAH